MNLWTCGTHPTDCSTVSLSVCSLFNDAISGSHCMILSD
jgi:hypothetical protein